MKLSLLRRKIMKEFILSDVVMKVVPELDRGFQPAVLANRAYKKSVEESGKAVPLKIALERGNGLVSTHETKVFDDKHKKASANFPYAERLVKTLLWSCGAWKVTIAGSESLGKYIQSAYSKGGIREFDADFMAKVYEKPFTVEITDLKNFPAAKTQSRSIGRHLDGCRIGFDAGGSDRKVSAVIDGEAVFSEEVIWHPKTTEDPDYHYSEMMNSIKTAAEHLPRVDAIGVSAAGIYINNRVMAASLFIKVPEDKFEEKVKDMFIDIAGKMGDVPLQVANDGDVTALAGAMDLDDSNVFGIAMGTSEAGGYVDGKGHITGKLNELAFVPVDFNPKAAVHEWSGDFGCGANYFSQDAVIKLAPAAGIELDEKLTPAEKLKFVQKLHEKGHDGAVKIFETVGVYLGYAIAYYAQFYDIKHILILGRVTSGNGGVLIKGKAENVLKTEFPELADKIRLHLPDESSRRVGQSIAAASLPKIKNRL